MIKHNHFVLLLILFCCIASGCSHIGEAAGKAKAGIENAISDTKSGYNKGYSEEKGNVTEKSSQEKKVTHF